MNWPHKIDCTINAGEDNLAETTATLLRSLDSYGKYDDEGVLVQGGPIAEYETASGLRFWIEAEYMQVCLDRKLLPDIPMEVVTRNDEIREKLQYGQTKLAKQAVEKETGLILPDGYEANTV